MCLFVSLCPSQQFFSYVRTGLPEQGLMCLAQEHNAVTPVEGIKENISVKLFSGSEDVVLRLLFFKL